MGALTPDRATFRLATDPRSGLPASLAPPSRRSAPNHPPPPRRRLRALGATGSLSVPGFTISCRLAARVGRIEFTCVADRTIHLQLLSTPPRGDAVTDGEPLVIDGTPNEARFTAVVEELRTLIEQQPGKRAIGRRLSAKADPALAEALAALEHERALLERALRAEIEQRPLRKTLRDTPSSVNASVRSGTAQDSSLMGPSIFCFKGVRMAHHPRAIHKAYHPPTRVSCGASLPRFYHRATNQFSITQCVAIPDISAHTEQQRSG